jgi:hypothetical protein
VSEPDARKQGANAPEGIILEPGEGQTIGTGGITLRATGEETGGSIGFLEATTPRGPGHLAMFTMAAMSYSTSLRGSSSSWSGSAKSADRLGCSSSSLGARCTPQRLSGPSRARCLRPTYRGAKSDPSRSTVGCRARLWPRNTTLSSWDHLYSSPTCAVMGRASSPCNVARRLGFREDRSRKPVCSELNRILALYGDILDLVRFDPGGEIWGRG